MADGAIGHALLTVELTSWQVESVGTDAFVIFQGKARFAGCAVVIISDAGGASLFARSAEEGSGSLIQDKSVLTGA